MKNLEKMEKLEKDLRFHKFSLDGKKGEEITLILREMNKIAEEMEKVLRLR